METLLDPALKENVRLLGDLLSEVIQQDLGKEFVDKIVQVRTLAKQARAAEQQPLELITLLNNLADDDITPITRAFNQFLNLANIAEQYHDVIHTQRQMQQSHLHQLESALDALKTSDDQHQFLKRLQQLKIELVLTAHPTEVTRRTLIQKYDQILNALNQLDNTPYELERKQIRQQLKRTIAEIWHTDEIRQRKPTPEEEAKWGFAVIENSLWSAIPRFYAQLDELLEQRQLPQLPLSASPIRFYSWMGGDRDGNPNVTANVTRNVILMGRWMAADLYMRDLDTLIHDLSMSKCNELLRAAVGDVNEPYRHLLHQLRQQLKRVREGCQQALDTPHQNPDFGPITHVQALIDPLTLCYQSLMESGMATVAQGKLKDTLRRAHCFGLNLSPLDVRQESTRHTQVLSELTQYLGLGDYAQWPENQRQAFLIEELENKRPLLPASWPVSEASQEVLDTCGLLAEHENDCFASYVISMAGAPSDVLSVALLLKMSGRSKAISIAPLFETLDDLTQAAPCIDALLNIPWYQKYCQGQQMVMIGYSDSAKDAGQLAAAWAQYKAQETLVEICDQHQVELMLFHGRGGTVGRGGGPAHGAILSQPPGSVRGRIRVTEQGEMIRFKLGYPEVAMRTFQVYMAAVLNATSQPPPQPKQQWRQSMEALSQTALAAYRDIVRESDEFVPYFRALTPEQELAKLALGSRPAKRKASGGVESLRAIPWIFAWMQVRLMLPAWLGTESAFGQFQQPQQLQQMARQWPFFQTLIDMLEMVLSKTDGQITAYYEQRLIPQDQQTLGRQLRSQLNQAQQCIRQIKQIEHLLENNPAFRHSMAVRNPYTDPLHYLQAELLKRTRESSTSSAELEHALKVTMAGIAAGMRNTG